MKGSFGFEHVLGLRQEVRAVSRDFILARKVGDIRYGKYFLFYRGVEKWMYIGYEDIIWAYRHLEQIRGKRGKGTGMEMHFLMLVTKGKKMLSSFRACISLSHVHGYGNCPGLYCRCFQS